MSVAAAQEYTPVTGDARATARSLTLWYVLASTAIFLVAGLLGAALRQSQADIVRLDDNVFYAVMTAHGLGAFVGWAAFAVMGFAWWVLAEVGFPIGTWAHRIARLAFWSMIIGVAGVVVTTLFFGFAGSWVFLYPLPFHSAGQWGDVVTAAFSASVLMAGVSIIAWCVAILMVVTGPGLGSEKGLWNRMGAAMGLGILWPRKFATAKPVPYPVIPLTVIAIDMIIATVPLAALLVEMIFQTFTSVSVNPQLAKNVLWWFGHPVVYLLLFPAVAIYYLLVPRFAQRPLVAGNIIAVGWTIAVIANVTVWAHHLYMDYPNGIQAAINTGMEPLTFALTIVSALSLYSLFMTIFRSRWEWTASSTALFLGLVSWLLAGLSGVVNATIAWDSFVHNTLWVVGHFHHMALLNIGIVIFGAIYAFLPALVDKPLYSDRIGIWHVWITFVSATLISVLWIAQGLQGAPRRFSVLPGQYDQLTDASIPLVVVLGLAQLLLVWNVVQTLRGKQSYRTQRVALGVQKPKVTSPALQGFVMVLTLLALGGLAAAGWAIGSRNQEANAAFLPAVEQPAPGASPQMAAGQQVFVDNGCGSCHSLSAAGATGTVGPNLDQAKPSEALVVDRVTNGLGGMPSFSAQLTPEQIQAVAVYVSQSAGAAP
ncbi:MAG: cbb3-type cytochrome c oxidase subunit I [Thermoleophilia bacterium]